jgi:hypothetical protein
MSWQIVTSSELHAIKYDDKTLVLEIHFRNGRMYRYTAVPESIYRALLAAESKGRFFNALIRDKYPYQRVV